jgi:hypothetical protein
VQVLQRLVLHLVQPLAGALRAREAVFVDRDRYRAGGCVALRPFQEPCSGWGGSAANPHTFKLSTIPVQPCTIY